MSSESIWFSGVITLMWVVLRHTVKMSDSSAGRADESDRGRAFCKEIRCKNVKGKGQIVFSCC